MELHDSDEDVLFLYSFKIESVEFFFKRVAITSLNFHFSTTERMASLRSTHKKRYPIKIRRLMYIHPAVHACSGIMPIGVEACAGV